VRIAQICTLCVQEGSGGCQVKDPRQQGLLAAQRQQAVHYICHARHANLTAKQALSELASRLHYSSPHPHLLALSAMAALHAQWCSPPNAVHHHH
jgi:hypothetical protein